MVGLATTEEDALELVDEHHPDVFILENGNGDASCLTEARKRFPALRAVVLSADEEPAHIQAAFAAGATAYIVKTAHPDDIEVAVRQAFGPSLFLARDRGAAPVPVAATLRPTREAEAQEASATLTRRELEILQLVAEGHSNSQLARMLWVTEQTVKFHLSNIYRKLDVANRTEASRWAQLHGLLHTSTPNAAAMG